MYETLYYAAMLRLPRSMSHVDKVARVDAVITALGLDKCRGTIIGGFFRRGISGGERKRVSVGHELLINPSVLLLDEPTSGELVLHVSSQRNVPMCLLFTTCMPPSLHALSFADNHTPLPRPQVWILPPRCTCSSSCASWHAGGGPW